jgi:hypothetical protein
MKYHLILSVLWMLAFPLRIAASSWCWLAHSFSWRDNGNFHGPALVCDKCGRKWNYL